MAYLVDLPDAKDLHFSKQFSSPSIYPTVLSHAPPDKSYIPYIFPVLDGLVSSPKYSFHFFPLSLYPVTAYTLAKLFPSSFVFSVFPLLASYPIYTYFFIIYSIFALG